MKWVKMNRKAIVLIIVTSLIFVLTLSCRQNHNANYTSTVNRSVDDLPIEYYYLSDFFINLNINLLPQTVVSVYVKRFFSSWEFYYIVNAVMSCLICLTPFLFVYSICIETLIRWEQKKDGKK